MDLGKIGEGNAFRCPWRPPGAQYGRVLRVGLGSVFVRAPKLTSGDSWEWDKSSWAITTQVEPADLDDYLSQAPNDAGPRADWDRSTVESPVKVVHRICDEMKGAERDAIVARCVELGVNENTAKTQFYAWRRKHG